MENERKRDWVGAALDQWEKERRASGRRRRLPYLVSSMCVALAGLWLGLNQSFHSTDADPANEILGAVNNRLLPSDRESLRVAQNRVFGLMNGRQLRSRQSVSRLGRGVSRLNTRLSRNSSLSIENGS